MKSLICPIIILIIISCTQQDIMIGRNILIKEFPQEINLSGEKLDITSIGVNNIFVVDTFLICYKAMGLDEFFDIYSTNTYQSLGKFLSPGRGPNEFLNATYMGQHFKDSSNTYMWIKDEALMKLTLFNLTESVKQQKTLNDSSLFYHYFSFSNRNEYYSIYNRKTNTFIQQDSIYRHSINNIGNIFLWTTHSCYNLREQKYATAMEFLNQINLYSLSQKKAISLVYNGNISDLKKVEECPMPEKYTYYVDFTSTTKLLFGLYANQTRKDWALKDNITTEIHVIDWEGIPKFKLNIQEKLSKIAINEKEKIMYGLTLEEEVYKYNLEEIL